MFKKSLKIVIMILFPVWGVLYAIWSLGIVLFKDVIVVLWTSVKDIINFLWEEVSDWVDARWKDTSEKEKKTIECCGNCRSLEPHCNRKLIRAPEYCLYRKIEVNAKFVCDDYEFDCYTNKERKEMNL